MEKIKKLINYIFFVCQFLAISVSYPTTVLTGNLLMRLTNRLSVTVYQSFFGVLVVVFVVFFQCKYHRSVIKWSDWPYWFFGMITACLYVITLSVSNLNVNNLTGKLNVFITIIALLGFSYLFTNFAALLGQLISHLKLKKWLVNYWLVVFILIVVWFLQVFPLLPGLVTWDGYRQFVEYFHTYIPSLNFAYYPTGHHPWSATLILGFLFSIGRAIGGVNVGLFTIVLVQILLAALIFAKVVFFVGKNCGKIAAILAMIFYSSPFVAFWEVTIEKTPLFLTFTTWFVLTYAEILLINRQKNVSKWLYIEITFSGIMMAMFRNDGVYVVFLSLIVLIIVESFQSKKDARQLLFGFLIFLTAYLGWYKVALPLMNVLPGSTGEAISVPMRQLSAVVIHNPKSLSKNDLAVIDKITPIKDIPVNFNVNNVDNLKSLYPVDTFLRSPAEIKMIQSGKLKKTSTPVTKKETSDYLKVWIEQAFQHPTTYIATFLAGNSQFLNPIIDDNPGSRGIMYGNGYMKSATFLQPGWFNEVHYWMNDSMRRYISWPNIIFSLPIIRTILQPAFALWTILFSTFYLMYRKSFAVLICIPVGLLCLISLLSPLNGGEKYILPAMYVLPVILSVVIATTQRGFRK
ncbi:hypothetical protein R82291_FJPPFKPJ_00231 [Fructobacillus cardui]|uniref:DUF6020 family protein n=1 Tax=Fructobacillus cardui TaxID=2893170 RepID=UPI002DB3B88F|nr:hypothetical protein R82291_FJPPFKPJ_00231 [Fructobacillus cardui]